MAVGWCRTVFCHASSVSSRRSKSSASSCACARFSQALESFGAMATMRRLSSIIAGLSAASSAAFSWTRNCRSSGASACTKSALQYSARTAIISALNLVCDLGQSRGGLQVISLWQRVRVRPESRPAPNSADRELLSCWRRTSWPVRFAEKFCRSGITGKLRTDYNPACARNNADVRAR